MRCIRGSKAWFVGFCAIFLFFVCFNFFICGTASVALGQTKVIEPDEEPDEATRARYEQATRMMQNGKPVMACSMLEDIVTANPQYAAAKQALADCYVAAGKLLSATRLYDALEKEAADGQQAVLKKVIADKRQALASRMSHLRVVLPDCLNKAKDLVVVVDGEQLPRQAWGEARPADRGPHKIEVSSLGTRVWHTVADVWEEGATRTVHVDVHPPYLGCKSDGPASMPPSGGDSWLSKGRAVGLTIGAFGAASIGIGAGFGGAAMAANHDAEAFCNVQKRECLEEGRELQRESLRYGTASTGFLVAGGVLMATGVVVIVLSPGKRADSTRIGVGPSGVSLRGAF